MGGEGGGREEAKTGTLGLTGIISDVSNQSWMDWGQWMTFSGRGEESCYAGCKSMNTTIPPLLFSTKSPSLALKQAKIT